MTEHDASNSESSSASNASRGDLAKLARLIRDHKDHLLATWRLQVRQLPSAAGLDTPTLNDHIPVLLLEISDALLENSGETIADQVKQESPPVHGVQRLEDGFDIVEVVAEYNILRGAIHDLAQEHGVTIQGQPFHILNRVLDGAIGLAVQSYAEHRAQEVRQRRVEHLSFIVHDLRTPLNASVLATEYLQRQAPDASQEQAAEMFAILERNLRQMHELTSELVADQMVMEEEELTSLVKRSLELWPLVESLCKRLQPLCEEHKVTIRNLVPYHLRVHGDASKIQRVLQNLVANAIRFTPGGEIEVGALEESSWVECWVKDDGNGIPADRIHSIFEPMETDQNPGEGHGLGLAIVKNFVELHDGQVSVDSEPGKGTTIRFTLPKRA